jgi:hypothetical protein
MWTILFADTAPVSFLEVDRHGGVSASVAVVAPPAVYAVQPNDRF